MSRPTEFSSRDAHVLVICEHLRDMGAAVCMIPIEWEGVTYEVSVVAVGQGAKTRAELEEDAAEVQQLRDEVERLKEALRMGHEERAMAMYGATSDDLHVCGMCDGTGYVA